MIANVHLVSSGWQEKNEGKIKQRGTCLSDCNELIQAKNIQSVSDALRLQNGFYALVWKNADTLYAAVDHIRSIPLFYALKDGAFYLSDDADWVRKQVGNTVMDEIAKEEFQLAGYVTGRDTLYPDVKQLQAGEFLHVNTLSESPKVETERYYRFLHTEPETFNETELSQQLEHVLLASIDNLIRYANGRQIVIPLSGGYDSRLIAALLKRRGYENILCFTYGVPGNKEALFSQRVAKELGFDWAFVEYSAKSWKKAWRTKEAEDYRAMASNHTSLPHVQDWLAIRELISVGRITKSSIVVPGHSGDFVAGSHIPKLTFESSQHDEDVLYRSLIKDHLSNAPKEGMLLADSAFLRARLRNRIGLEFDGSDKALANLYELWDWQERQSKYIVNSVRVYEQFEIDWWLPLWDIEFVRFWQRVPLTLRKERIWFKSWIEKQYLTVVSNNKVGAKSFGNATDHSRMVSAIIFLVKKMPKSIQDVLIKKWRSKKSKKHFLAFEGLVPDDKIDYYFNKNYNIIGVYSDLYIRSEW